MNYNKLFYTKQEAAQQFGVGLTTLGELVRQNILVMTSIGRRKVVSAENMEACRQALVRGEVHWSPTPKKAAAEAHG
jgi:hypothetical protein